MDKLLDKIDSPSDLKKLRLKQLPQLAEEIREEMIRVVSRAGGHLASSLGAVELTVALHYVFDSPQDAIVWDVGHQAYSHKILTGRKKRFPSLRQSGGISGFPNKDESPHDLFTVGHASTSISQALGLAAAKDLASEKRNVIAVIGDGALTGGMAFEALNHAGQLGKKMIVVLNSNEMAISRSVGALSKYLNEIITNPIYNRVRKDLQTLIKKIPRLGSGMLTTVKRLEESLKGLLIPGRFFEEMGFRYFGPIDGHNIALIVRTLKNIIQMNDPVLIHLVTKKGRGYKWAEQYPVRFHSAKPFDIKTGVSKPKELFNVTYAEVFGRTLRELASIDKKLVVITPAMTAGSGLIEFVRDFPERFFDVGIAEQHAVAFAAGLAKGGLKPMIAVYSTFLQRAYDQIIHDVCLQNLNVIFAVDRAGIVGEDGPTHHGVFDIAYLGHIPNLVLMAPKDEKELKDMLFTAFSHSGPIALRYPKTKGREIEIDKNYRIIPIGQAEIMRTGGKIAIVAIGSMVYPALEAAEKLSNQGIETTVVNARFIRPLDEALLEKLLSRKIKTLITVEEHIGRNGFGSLILEFLAKKGKTDIKVERLTLPDSFIEQSPRELLLDKYGLSAAGIVEAAKKIL
ncbi:MAG: 1-deoxy-D-xylulose-5-phosphate synthase [Candidatus Omnitrophota bacterium]|nr:1-deoxy-D-xylulose-5-phosphate synthase [Candidatus Omnitrophota bacterium]